MKATTMIKHLQAFIAKYGEDLEVNAIDAANQDNIQIGGFVLVEELDVENPPKLVDSQILIFERGTEELFANDVMFRSTFYKEEIDESFEA